MLVSKSNEACSRYMKAYESQPLSLPGLPAEAECQDCQMESALMKLIGKFLYIPLIPHLMVDGYVEEVSLF